MKIFNWVHRRFTHDKGEFISENVKEDESKILTKEGDETKALLDNVVLTDFLADGWKGGLLSIGTLGSFDNFKDQTLMKEDEPEPEPEPEPDLDLDLDDDEEEGESNPLMRSSSSTSIITVDHDHVISYSSDSKKWDDDDDDCMNKKERVTLAELFSAESDEETYNTYNSKKGKMKLNMLMMNKKPNAADHAIKLGGGSKKNLADGVKDDSRPLKKLYHLMKRILKRKIHPVVAEAKTIPKDLHWTRSSSSTGSIPSIQLGDSDSNSLIQIPDVVCMV